MSWPDATVVDACVRRDGGGGSPTAVTDDDPAATDVDRRAVAAAAGTSHAAFLGPGRTPDGGWPVRFFTATAELSGCGHGTVAAQAARLTRTTLGELNDRQHTGGRTFDTVAIRRPAGIEVWFDQGLIALRHPAPDERAAIVAALGLTADDPHPTDAPRIAAPGAPRMLVPVHDRSALLRVCPHLGRLTAARRRGTGSSAVSCTYRRWATDRLRRGCSRRRSVSTRTSPTPTAPAAWPPTCSTRQGHRRSRSRWSRVTPSVDRPACSLRPDAGRQASRPGSAG